uniref:Uncharacterized protein n=1 Tax=Anguilla anguilla TaxID=7936 RepID=A0A0E9Q2K6_ANGAN
MCPFRKMLSRMRVSDPVWFEVSGFLCFASFVL